MSERSPISVGLLVAACVSSGACSGPRTPVGRATASASASAAPVVDRCDEARALASRAASALVEGKLDRALRVVRKAQSLCAATPALGLETEQAALAELATGKDTAFEDTDAAKAPMRQAYRDAAAKQDTGDLEGARAGYLKAWELWHPNGQALLQAGLVAKKLGDAPGAQRLFDRGIAELEAATGTSVKLDAANGFDGPLEAIAWSKLGRLALVHGRVVSIVAQGTLREVVRLEGHTRDVFAVAFSPDGKQIATASGDATVRLWDVSTGRSVRTFTATSPVLVVAFSPDGTLVAAGEQTEKVHLWEVDTGTERASLASYGSTYALAFSPDGKQLAVSRGFGVRLWDVATAQVSASCAGEALVRSLAFSPDGKQLVSGGAEDVVRVWDVSADKTCKAVRALDAAGGVTAVAFSPDGARVAAASPTKTVRIWKGKETKPSVTFDRHAERATGVAFSPDGALIASSSTDGSAAIFRPDTGEVVRAVGRHADVPLSLGASPDGRSVVVGTTSGSVLAWSLDRSDVRRLDLWSPIRAVAFSPDAKWIAAGEESGELALWSGDPTERPTKIEAHTAGIESVAFHPAGDRVFTGSRDNGIRAWAVPGGGASGTPMYGSNRGVYGLAISPDGKFIVSGGDSEGLRGDHDLGLIDLLSPAEPRRLPGHSNEVHAVAFSRTGQILGSIDGGELLLWDAREWKVTRRITRRYPSFAHGQFVHDRVAFSPDGAFVATPSGERTLHVWEVATGKDVGTLSDHAGAVNDVAFLAGGGGVATADDGGAIRLFDAKTWAPIATARSLVGDDAAYVFTPDGYIEFRGSGADRARQHPLCRVGPYAFDFAVCQERFEVPGLLAKVAAADASYRDP